MCNQLVPYDVTWTKGGPTQYKPEGTLPVEGMNNIGVQGKPSNPSGWFNEGGRVSRLGNQVPGINAVAGLHDVFQITLNRWGGAPLGWALNAPGMPVAAAVTYGALVAVSYGQVGMYAVGSTSASLDE